MSLGRTVKLNNGVVIPQVGYGTWQAAPGEVEKAVEEAIKVGYRHIDCALVYRSFSIPLRVFIVATGIKASGVPREELVLVSKLWNNSHRPENVEADLDLTLKQLGTSYLDVYLIHWPVAFKPGKDLFPKDSNGVVQLDEPAEKGGPSIVDTWKEMVRISKETKKVKAVGVSNFTVEQLKKVIDATGVTPSMNQIELHPSLIQPELFKFCNDNGIAITAYSPLGNNITGKPRVIDHPEIKKIADRLGKSPAQVLIAWVAKQGFVVIPKSVTPARIKSNFEDFELSDADLEEINKIGLANQVRSNIPFEYETSWPVDIFGTPEEKGQVKAF
ncbi:uncharacterized protein I206_103139 [Kwoniella pini CBS 10737]|uniref:Oxidoreductase n=1 Tax=Kwoniella pini CBS 10737 TaxID=1296096 RepID=A0A1B9IAD4_9TREE|nr:oxidoreductase [Kwoniella pini CBS 10737]OCF52565.1 oxidoreductase [Kwoniella pini CBS 10737]